MKNNPFLGLAIEDAPHILIAGGTAQERKTCADCLEEALLAQDASTEVLHIGGQDDAEQALEALCAEMTARLKASRKARERLPRRICFIDEFADVPLQPILELAAKGRVARIHLIVATQRLTTDVITGQVKAHFPTRIVFKTNTKEESILLLDLPGAEKLSGDGDLILSSGLEVQRIPGLPTER